ncbi:MAG: hypothetical protein QXJ28_00665 [Candidatus Pacearchaeota archaeon]
MSEMIKEFEIFLSEEEIEDIIKKIGGRKIYLQKFENYVKRKKITDEEIKKTIEQFKNPGRDFK